MFDELKILITGDTGGIETAMKKALNVVVGGVDQMNSQEVDWTGIFSRAVSPAIISSVASVMANAISQFVQFNDAAANLNNIATPAVQSFGNSIGTTGGQVYSLAETAQSSLGDTTAAFEAFSKAGLNSAAATAATTDAAGIARDTGESMGSVVAELATLFQSWGVTTVPQVTDALTGLVNAAQNGNLTFDQLVQTIATQGDVLKSQTSISSVSIQLAALSTQSGLTQADVIAAFNAIVTGAANPLSNMSLLVKGVSKDISSGPDGLITAFGAVESFIQAQAPSVQQTMGQTIGLSTNLVQGFGSSTQTNFTNAASAADKIRGSLVPLNKNISDNEPAMAHFVADWQEFSAIMASITIPALLPGLSGLLSTIDSDLTSLKNLVNGTSTDKVGDAINVAAGAAGAVGIGSGALAGAIGGATLGLAGGPAAWLTVPIGTILGALVGGGAAALVEGVGTSNAQKYSNIGSSPSFTVGGSSDSGATALATAAAQLTDAAKALKQSATGNGGIYFKNNVSTASNSTQAFVSSSSSQTLYNQSQGYFK